MSIEEDFSNLEVAYRNALNDLKRMKEHLKEIEDLLIALTSTIKNKRIDQHGTGGSGGSHD
jgi:wobble nucleotide-excising tRNase